MKYLKTYTKLFESTDEVVDTCKNLLMDIHDDDIPVSVSRSEFKTDIFQFKNRINIFIGNDESCLYGLDLHDLIDDDGNFTNNHFNVNFKNYLNVIENLNKYLESESFKLDFAHILYISNELKPGSRGILRPKTKAIDNFNELVSFLKSEPNIIAIDSSYK